MKSQRYLSDEAGRDPNLSRYAAEDPVRRMCVNGVNHLESVNFPARSVSLSLELQVLSFTGSKYKPTYMNVKRKSEVIEIASPTLAARIRQLRKSLGMNQTEFGHALAVTQVAVSNWEKESGDTPAPKTLAVLAEMTSDPVLRAEFLERAGFREKRTSGPPHQEEFRAISLLSDSAAAGTNRVVDEREIEKVLLLPREWFHRGGELFGLKVTGDSMAPIIEEGYIVVVDTSQRDPKKLVNKMVAARDGDGVTIKWLRRDVGLYLLIPQNVSPRHQVRVLSSDSGFGIVGEVVKWIGQPARK